jgi:NTP pyrophosphatase (non-canonical NTP hydrolase)
MFQTAIDHLNEEVNKLNIAGHPAHTSPIQELIDKANSLMGASRFLSIAYMGGVSALIASVRQWGVDRKIIGPERKGTVSGQMTKLEEEMEELAVGIDMEDQHACIDGIGDMTVVLILLADMLGVKFEDCLLAAYEEIRDRKGTIDGGVFIKEKAIVTEV